MHAIKIQVKVKVMKRKTCASWEWIMSLIDDNCDVDPSSMLIEIYDKCKNNSKLIFLKKEKECSNNDFQKLVLENKNLCEKVSSLEKCLIDYEFLKKKVNDEKKILKNFLVHKDLLMIKMALDTTILMLHQSKHILLKLLHPSPILFVLIVESFKMLKTKNANVGREGHGEAGGSSRGGKKGKGKQVARSESPYWINSSKYKLLLTMKIGHRRKGKSLRDIESIYQTREFYANLQRDRAQSAGNVVTSRIPEDGIRFYTKNKKCFDPNLYSEKMFEDLFTKGIVLKRTQLNDRLDDINGNLHIRLDELDEKIVDIHNRVIILERGGKDNDEDEDD
ncbi:hypothetical protein M9H77_12104 [Catharanthus roseus]|uniref:Uncharacterized protein n=1 Tax=Catharanthus roseus TaxID=4058 RepID=A0ACC0BGH4_CATRO|nr:hypothetical protein M9H77_12104 [Catharanthus roseus]